jgi:site-specific recombinase XerD
MTIVTDTQSSVKIADIASWVVAGDPALVNAFVAWLREQDHSAATMRGYRIGVTTFQTWFEGTTGQALNPALITPLDVRAFKAHLQKTLKANSVNHYLAGLRAFCAWALATGRAEHNPVTNIKLVKQAERAPKWLTRQEQYALLRAVEQEVQLGELRAKGGQQDAGSPRPGAIWPKRDRALVRLLLAAGLRLSEAAALRLADVEIKPRSGSVTVRSGKGNKRRIVPLNADARKALGEWLEISRSARNDEEALFLSQKGGALSARAMAEVVAMLGSKAGLDGLHPHILRHSCAKNLVDQGIGIEKVAMILGHESLETTRLYTMPSEGDLQAAVESTCWED